MAAKNIPRYCLITLAALLLVGLVQVEARGKKIGIYDQKVAGNWVDASATFYGDMTGGETMRK